MDDVRYTAHSQDHKDGASVCSLHAKEGAHVRGFLAAVIPDRSTEGARSTSVPDEEIVEGLWLIRKHRVGLE